MTHEPSHQEIVDQDAEMRDKLPGYLLFVLLIGCGALALLTKWAGLW